MKTSRIKALFLLIFSIYFAGCESPNSTLNDGTTVLAMPNSERIFYLGNILIKTALK